MPDRVDSVELFHVSKPLPATFWPAWIPGYPQTHNRFTLLRLRTAGGLVGWAAGAAIARERQGLGDLIGPYLLGLDPNDLDAVRMRIREMGYLGWRNAWIEIAFLDLASQAANRPLYRFLEPERETVKSLPVYASSGEVREPEARRPWIEQVAALGIETGKLRVHSPELETDLAQLRGLADQGLRLAVDANQGWPVSLVEPTVPWDLDRARRFAEAAAELELAWIEEPLDADDHAGIAALRQASPVPIAGGELAAGFNDLVRFFEHSSYDILQPDCAFTGVGDAVRTYRRCAAEGLGFTPHTWTNGVGLLANLHVAAASGTPLPLEYPFEPPGWVPEARDALLAEPLRVQQGRVAVPQRPGLGAVIDPSALRRHGRRFYKLTPFRLSLQVIRDKGLGQALELKRRKEG